jgi:hypothetical protein
VDALLDKAGAAAGEERVRLYQEAWKLLYDDAAFMPIARLQPIVALSERLEFTPRMDDFAPVQDMSLVE